MFSIISEDAYDIFKKINLENLKIASRSLKYNFDLVKKIVEEKKYKKIYMSLGMWEKEQFPFIQKNIEYLW